MNAQKFKEALNSEPVDVLIKREYLNGMGKADIGFLHKIDRTTVDETIDSIDKHDREMLKGNSLADCISGEAKQMIIDVLSKSSDLNVITNIAFVTKIPSRIISAIHDSITSPRNNKIEYSEIMADVESGMTQRSIATKHNISQATVSHIRKSRNKHLTDNTVLEIANYIVKGFTNDEIAEKFNTSASVISKIRCKKSFYKITANYSFPRNNSNRAMFTNGTMSKEQFYKIIEMLMLSKTDKEIADDIGVLPESVYKIRKHITFTSITKDMIFPDPVSLNIQPDAINIDPILDSPESVSTFEDIASDENSDSDNHDQSLETNIDNDDVIDDSPETSANVIDLQPEIIIGTHKYYMNIAKAFAANKCAAILVNNDKMIAYIVDNTTSDAVTKLIALSTPAELHAGSVYVAGEVNANLLTHMLTSIGVRKLIIS